MVLLSQSVSLVTMSHQSWNEHQLLNLKFKLCFNSCDWAFSHLISLDLVLISSVCLNVPTVYCACLWPVDQWALPVEARLLSEGRGEKRGWLPGQCRQQCLVHLTSVFSCAWLVPERWGQSLGPQEGCPAVCPKMGKSRLHHPFAWRAQGWWPWLVLCLSTLVDLYPPLFCFVVLIACLIPVHHFSISVCLLNTVSLSVVQLALILIQYHGCVMCIELKLCHGTFRNKHWA